MHTTLRVIALCILAASASTKLTGQPRPAIREALHQQSDKSNTSVITDSNDSVNIRLAHAEDLGAIAALMSSLAGEDMSLGDARNRLDLVRADPSQELLVAFAGTEVAGLLGFRIRHNLESVSQFVEVSSIVDERWRNKGIGRLLMSSAEALAREHGCIGMWLVSGFGREEEAHKFYHRLGFQSTGVRLVKLFEQDQQ